MLTTLRRDRRIRRQALFNLERLDDRLVLSAAAAGAVAEAAGAKAPVIEQRHEARLARIEARHARHEARLARVEARHEARLAVAAAHAVAMASVTPVNIGVSGSAMASSPAVPASPATATSATATPTAIATTNSSLNPSSYVPHYPVTATPTSTSSGSSNSSSGSSGTLPPNVAAALQSLYQEYENAGGGDSFTPSQPSDNQLQISGTSVMVNLKMASSGDFNTFLSQLQSDGLQVSNSSAFYGLVDGMLPIADLPTVATVAASVTAVPPPTRS